MLNTSFWTYCRQATEAISCGRLGDASRHLAEARIALTVSEQADRVSWHEILNRYDALLTGRRQLSSCAKPIEQTAIRGVPQLSLVSSVFNRLWQLKDTMPGNLATIRAVPDVDIVLVDFGGSDSIAIQEFIEQNFSFDLLSGKLKYFIAKEPWTQFHMATAKNVACRLSTGRFLFSLDADNHFRSEDLTDVLTHCRSRGDAVLHQTTGPAPMRHKMWARYELFDESASYHNHDATWDGSSGRIGCSRAVFDRVNGYNENFIGMGMDDIDFLIRCIRAGSEYRHTCLDRPAGEIFIDNGSADAKHQHANNQHNWQIMDAALTQGELAPSYQSTSSPELFARYIPRFVRRSTESRVTLFASLFAVAPYIDRFLRDLGQIAATPGVCVWLFDVVGSHPSHVSEALVAVADGHTVFYVPVHHDPGLYALWNTAILGIGSPFLGNLNADDLRGFGWLRACLAPLEAGLTDVASPFTVPFEDARAVDHSAVLATMRSEGAVETRWFDSRVIVEGCFPNERPRHVPLVNGEYSSQDLFQAMPDGTLASYCIPNASAVWSRRVHDLAGYFDETRFGSFADLALWAEAGSRGLRFQQVPFPALFFIGPQQAHRRQAHNDEKLVQLALRHGSPATREFVARRQFDLSRIGGSYGDHHFMGWNWVRDTVATEFRHTTPRVLLDMFLERNFFWNSHPDESAFVFRQPWVSFVHTTSHDSLAFDHKGQSLDALLNDPRFRQSLDCCRGLIVLSEHTQLYLRERLREYHESFPIYRLFHPNIPITEPQEPCTIDLGSDISPKIFHVGWHLRSFSAFARLRVDRSRKVLLVPKNLTEGHFLREVVDKELRLSGLGRAKDYFGEIYSASQSDYAHILRRAVIFNHYLQPAGSNLISECISAGARLVVNRHPAFEEYLGTDYPLFYDSLEEADAKLDMACSPFVGQVVQEHLASIQESWSIRKFCRDLSRIGEDIYARA